MADRKQTKKGPETKYNLERHSLNDPLPPVKADLPKFLTFPNTVTPTGGKHSTCEPVGNISYSSHSKDMLPT
jgi:hypothetical protein